jgi:hypothetical protein
MDYLILTIYQNFADIDMLYKLSLTCKNLDIITQRYLNEKKEEYIFLRKLGKIPIKQDSRSKWCFSSEVVSEYDLEYFVSIFGNKMNKCETAFYYYYFIKNISTYGKTIEFGRDNYQFLIYKNYNYIKQLPSTSGNITINSNNNDGNTILLTFIMHYNKYINYKPKYESINIQSVSLEHGNEYFKFTNYDLDIDFDLLLKLMNFRGNWYNAIYFI